MRITDAESEGNDSGADTDDADEYVGEYTDSAMTDREELLSKTMLQAILSIMKKAVPEITKILEQ